MNDILRRVLQIGSAVGCVLVLAGSSPAWARPGFYLGVGAAQTDVGGGLDGTHSYTDNTLNPAPVFFDGKMKEGNGLAATVGYGFNRYFAIEYLYADTQHTATNSLLPNSTNAEFTSQTFGIRLTAPFSERFEGFLRAGYGLYEADYNSYAFVGPQVGKVAFSGTGTAIGAGFEVFFQELGIGLGYTQHSVSFDRATPSGGQKVGLPSNLSADVSTIDLLFTYHFGSSK